MSDGVADGSFGKGWSHNNDISLKKKANGDIIFLVGSNQSEVFLFDAMQNLYRPAPRVTSILERDGEGLFIRYDKGGIKYKFNSNLKILEIVDRNSNKLSFSYDSQGNLINITDPSGRIIQITYTSGRISSIADPSGRIFKYEYTSGFLSRVVYPDNKDRKYTYNPDGSIVSAIDRNGNTWSILYSGDTGVKYINPMGSVSEFKINTFGSTEAISTDLNGNTLKNTANPLGELAGFVDEFNDRIILGYDAERNMISQSGPRADTFIKTFDDTGNIVFRKTPTGIISSTAYDVWSNIIQETDAISNVESREYDAKGNMTKLTDKEGKVFLFDYDINGNQIKITDPNNNSKLFEYDQYGNKTVEIDALGNRTTYEYDILGRLIRTVDPLLRTTSYTYDIVGNLLSIRLADGSEISREYDANKNLTKSTSPGGFSSTISYNAVNRPVAITEPAGGVTSFEYDSSGNIKTVLNVGGQKETRLYDKFGRTIELQRPNIGGIIPQDIFAYDSSNNQIFHIFPNGDTIEMKYDLTNRLTEKSYCDGTKVRFEYDSRGLRTKMIDSVGITTWEYDKNGRMTKSTDPMSHSIIYTYDGAGNLIQMKDWENQLTTYDYDAANRLIRITDPDQGVTVFEYDAVGRRTKEILPNGSSAASTYVPLSNSVRSLVNRKSNEDTISSFVYFYDSDGRRASVLENNGDSTAWVYDSMGQLTREVKYKSTGETVFAFIYTYDALGNRLRKNDLVTGIAMNYEYDSNSRLTKMDTLTLSYDLNGNLIARQTHAGTTVYHYDFENNLIEEQTPTGETTAYAYDGQGRRIKRIKNTGTTHYIWEHRLSNIIGEVTSGDSPIVKNIYSLAVDRLIKQVRFGTSAYYHYDALGSVTELTAATNVLLNQYRYNAFGGIVSETENIANDYGFTSRNRESNGLYYYRSRFYAPDIGRFITKDYYEGSVFLPITLHKYLYAYNSPTNYRDPSGLGCGTEFETTREVTTNVVSTGAWNYTGSQGPQWGNAWNCLWERQVEYEAFDVERKYYRCKITIFGSLITWLSIPLGEVGRTPAANEPGVEHDRTGPVTVGAGAPQADIDNACQSLGPP